MMIDLIKTIKKVSKRHPGYIGELLPIRLFNYHFLKKGLDREVKAGTVNVQFHPEFPNLKIYKYSQDAVCERKWNIITLISRGLILDTQSKKVLATPFPKFFNLNELVGISNFSGSNFTSLEKLDGSMGILFFYNGWRIATGGSFVSDQANWANEYLRESICTSFLDVKVTYLLEIVYPENRIVVPYDNEDLYLLSAYKKGYELDLHTLERVAKVAGFNLPKIYEFNTLDDILKETALIDHTHEGFVVRFDSNGVRVKIKGDEYCRIHKLISRVTPIAVWEMLLNNDDMDKVKLDLPEEMESDYNNIVSILKNKYQEIMEGIEYASEMVSHLSNKELGLELSNKKSKFLEDKKFSEYRDFIFAKRQDSFYNKVEDVKSLMRKSIFKRFRPKSNYLEGYIPTSAMNRFNDSEM